MRILASPSPRMLLHLKDRIDHWKGRMEKPEVKLGCPGYILGVPDPSQNVSEGLRGDTRSLGTRKN